MWSSATFSYIGHIEKFWSIVCFSYAIYLLFFIAKFINLSLTLLIFFFNFLISFSHRSDNQLELKSEISLQGKKKSPNKRITSLEVPFLLFKIFLLFIQMSKIFLGF